MHNSINGCTNHAEDDNPTAVGSLVPSFNTGVEIDDGTKTNNRGLIMENDDFVKEETNHNETTTTTTTTTNNRILVQSSLIMSQIFFGVGSVVAALGLPKCNPFVFAMIREISAAILLSCLAIWSTTTCQPQQQKDVSIWNYKVRFFCLGMAIFANQSCAIVGIKLAGPVASAVWQPSQPIITAAICILMRWEPINLLRILGITFAFLGCIAMVLLSSSTNTTTNTTNHTHYPTMDNSADTNNNNNNMFLHSQREETMTTTEMMGFQKEILGNFFFFINCLGTSLYVILSKKPLQVFPSSLTVVATSYSVASICLIITCLGLYYYYHHHEAEVPFCPECTEFWYIPHNAYFALFYFIMFNSVGAYALITWANQYASGTLVMGYVHTYTFISMYQTILNQCIPFWGSHYILYILIEI